MAPRPWVDSDVLSDVARVCGAAAVPRDEPRFVQLQLDKCERAMGLPQVGMLLARIKAVAENTETPMTSDAAPADTTAAHATSTSAAPAASRYVGGGSSDGAAALPLASASGAVIASSS